MGNKGRIPSSSSSGLEYLSGDIDARSCLGAVASAGCPR